MTNDRAMRAREMLAERLESLGLSAYVAKLRNKDFAGLPPIIKICLEVIEEALSEREGGDEDEPEGPWEPDELDRRSPEIERLAAKLAWDRGGQTHPLSDFDLNRAEEIITGRVNRDAENHRLRRRVAELEAMLPDPPTPGDPS